MPRIKSLSLSTKKSLSQLSSLEAKYQSLLSTDYDALCHASEYIFLSAYKIWENYLEGTFVSFARYNEKIGRIAPNPFINPATERQALEIIKLEKDFIDWTNPDFVVTRAGILFKNSQIITAPIATSIQLLRDAKKIRNYVAHGSSESKRRFKDMSRQRLSRNIDRAGEYLLATPAGNAVHFNLTYLNLFKSLVSQISQ